MCESVSVCESVCESVCVYSDEVMKNVALATS